MHDPKTVAFVVNYPWTVPLGSRSIHPDNRWHPPFITIWHNDPERDGSDDSCGWFRPPLTKREREWCKEIITNPDDNIAHWFTGRDDDEKVYQLALTIRNFRRTQRHWWQHPKWHWWHWSFQIHPLQKLKRFLFSRCRTCGQRFPWGYCPEGTWGGHGPRWFRSELVWHHDCDPSRKRNLQGVKECQSSNASKT